jgi:hypothetical protein
MVAAVRSQPECAGIQRGRPCEVGQYAGNHSRTTNSQCLPCAIHDTLYEGQLMHFYTSAGRRYDDATSCDLACRPFSLLRDPADPALGCVSCETGNVLFKVFTQNYSACTFTCLAGYVRAGDDCALAPLQASTSSYWNHSLNVTHVRRVAVGGSAAFQLTVSHTSHGSFAVVVGEAEPSFAGRPPIALRRPRQTACCFACLWRVSTKNQLGLASSAEETCSALRPPTSVRLSDSQLEFDVPDYLLTELALCEVELNTSFGELACVLQVSIVDTVLLHHFSVAVPPVVHFLNVEHTTPPLARTVHQVTLSSCARRLPDSVQSNVGGAHGAFPVILGLRQCFLPVKFSSPSNHCISDCFRPCCHMLHSIVVLPLIGHSLGACRPLSTFRW